MTVIFLITSPLLLFGILIQNQFTHLLITYLIKVIKKKKKSEISKKIQEEYEDMFKTIEEGIAVFENMNLKFSNDSF